MPQNKKTTPADVSRFQHYHVHLCKCTLAFMKAWLLKIGDDTCSWHPLWTEHTTKVQNRRPLGKLQIISSHILLAKACFMITQDCRIVNTTVFLAQANSSLKGLHMCRICIAFLEAFSACKRIFPMLYPIANMHHLPIWSTCISHPVYNCLHVFWLAVVFLARCTAA